jgi:hypothetical protein
MNKYNWVITRAQISTGDIDGAIHRLDPAVIPDEEVYGLAGAVRLRVEGLTRLADLIADPTARKFFQALHERWPWAGYFLRLHPITADSPLEQIMDTSLFMALLLCRVDHLTYVETPQGVGLRYDADQFSRHLADLQIYAAQLAELVDFPPTFISQRDALIAQTVDSFFAAGQTVNSQRKP